MKSLMSLFAFILVIPWCYSQERLRPIEISDFSSSLMDFVNSPVWQASAQDLAVTPLVQDVLSRAPGVIFTQNGGPGSRGAFFLRGSESRHTLFMIDGLRLNDPTNTDRHFDTAFLFSNQYQDVQLQRGPSPVLYGGDATSGVIELSPRRGPRASESSLRQISLTTGSFDTLLASGQSDWKSQSHQGTFGIMSFKTQGFSRFNSQRTTSAEKDGAQSSQVFQASRHQWSQAFQTDLYLQGSLSEVEQDGFDNSGNPIDTSFDESQNKNLQFIQTTTYQGELALSWLKTGINHIERDIKTLSQEKEFYRGDIRQVQLGQEVKTGAHTTIAGFNLDQENYQDKKLKASNDILSGFIQQKMTLDELSFFLGGRGESHQRYGEFFAYESSLQFHPRAEILTYVKYAQGYKAPSLYQLFGPDSFGSPVGNPNLDPELNRSLEGGIAWSGRFVADLIVFQQDFKNLIAYTNQGYANRGTLRVQGAELSLLSPEHFWGQLRMNLGVLDFSKYSQVPLRRPPSYGNISWLLNQEKWGFEVGARFLASRFDNDFAGTRQRLSAYELLSGKIRYSQDASQDLILMLGNITDRQYEDIWGYAVAPLNLSLSWTKRF